MIQWELQYKERSRISNRKLAKKQFELKFVYFLQQQKLEMNQPP